MAKNLEFFKTNRRRLTAEQVWPCFVNNLKNKKPYALRRMFDILPRSTVASSGAGQSALILTIKNLPLPAIAHIFRFSHEFYTYSMSFGES
ncbi:hypothetical protein [Oceanisphaera sp. IT1-181]|uniref:hypothetical protein n=1 Tax=Oceanisphaera sp. IT1-181 TaxID=3081199 RepID=UPI0029CA6602|nr:hypothetical protein [Oceanisphaera sp. IT1-181]